MLDLKVHSEVAAAKCHTKGELVPTIELVVKGFGREEYQGLWERGGWVH